ncbi:MAG: hypothetical protein EBV03_08805, partial [Proteobacteria bacterium]|nr:hypothetical protein [Pseudomonadota bacterium]
MRFFQAPGKGAVRPALWGAGKLVAIFVALAFAFYTGFRFPSDWSVNYFQPGWQDGIYRRALVGTLLYPLGCLRFSINAIYLIQCSIMVAMLTLALSCAWRYGQLWALLVFLVTAAGGFLFNMTGYADQLLYLMAAGSVLLAPRSPLTAGAVMAASVTVHEEGLVLLPPLVAAYCCMTGDRDWRRWMRLFVPPGVMGGVVFVMVRGIRQQAVDTFYARAGACGLSVVRQDYYFDISNWSYFGNYYGTDYHYWQHRLVPLVFLACALVIAIGQKLPLGRLEKLVVAGACLSPLLMGFTAWDLE